MIRYKDLVPSISNSSLVARRRDIQVATALGVIPEILSNSTFHCLLYFEYCICGANLQLVMQKEISVIVYY
jgi:hypothetical protein